MTNTYFTICGLFCSILIVILFFRKEKINSPETKIYGTMIVSSLIDTTLVTTILVIAYLNFNPVTNLLIIILNKIDFIHYVLWPSLAFLYTFYISYSNIDHYNNVKKIVLYLDCALIGIEFFLPINTIYENNEMGIVGTGANFVYAVAIIYILLILILVIKNFHKGVKQKYIPLAILVLLLIVASVIRAANPTLLIIPAILVYINLIMYFTIENPDVKMIEELIKAQKLSEQTSNEKGNFIYTVSEDIEARLSNADKVYESVMELNPSDEIKNYMYDLKDIITGARNMLRKTINISDMDNKHLQTTNTKYNIKLLLESVYTLTKQNIKKDIDFRLNISEDLPTELYGDSIKLKQILTTILDNSISYTDKGFVELRVSSILKNNICRLIISAEDSGKGMDIYKQNEIMNNSSELTKEEIENLDGMNLNLKTIRKMINIIGGTFTIDSNSYGGTTVNITLDQRMVIEEKSKEEQNIEKYSEAIKSQKTCAIITLDKTVLKNIKTIAKKNDFKVEEFNVTKTCLDNIRNNTKYDVVFIDEYMEKIDARSFLNKVKEVEGFNGKVIVISKNKDIKSKKELLSLGFNNIIYIPIDKKELLAKIKAV